MSDIEKNIQKKLTKQGFIVMKNGWPDFLVKDLEGNLFVIEAKSKNDQLSKAQKQMLQSLADFGLSVFIVCETNKTSEKNITIRNMPINLWAKMKSAATLKHEDLSDYIINLLKENFNK